MNAIKPTTPTEHLIVELASKMARYEMALQGCLAAARNGAIDDDQIVRVHLRYIEKEAEEALNNGEALQGNSR